MRKARCPDCGVVVAGLSATRCPICHEKAVQEIQARKNMPVGGTSCGSKEENGRGPGVTPLTHNEKGQQNRKQPHVTDTEPVENLIDLLERSNE